MLVIIPARGGSKGLPGKNVRPLGGVPLIGHSIRAALGADRVSRVVVSTDDDEIARVSIELGAEVPFRRPPELAGDDSMVMDAYLYTVDRLAEETGAAIEAFCALLPTAPLRTTADIDAAIDLFRSRRADSVISVTEAPVPPAWYRRIDDRGVLVDYFRDSDAISNRQEHEQTYVPNGAIYIFRTEVLRSTRQYYTDRTHPYVMPRERSADIDDELDFAWAELLLARPSERR
ncbi:MAG: acylneuraminate cytidylyltransferase family protein [Proteobacteria bacterium]|nr:acylneuraminate cytidylyltransferase family protein [Pseudomonadota bacterium]